jgi:hypothetical protein
MKKFIVLYHAPIDAMKQMAGVPKEEQAKGMEAWMVWAQKCGDKLVDLGAPLMGGQRVNPDGKSADSTKEVCGYSILQAKDINEAKNCYRAIRILAGMRPAVLKCMKPCHCRVCNYFLKIPFSIPVPAGIFFGLPAENLLKAGLWAALHNSATVRVGSLSHGNRGCYSLPSGAQTPTVFSFFPGWQESPF